MRGNSQNGGQTTKSLLIKPQCSGVPIQQAVSLSSSFPRHCLLFVCAFFRKMQAGARSEELPLSPVSCIQNRPGFHHGNRGGSFALGALFQALTQNLARGLWVSPAYAGKSLLELLQRTVVRDHPRVCGEKANQQAAFMQQLGSPPHVRGKENISSTPSIHSGITHAYAGKRLKRSRSTVPPVAIVLLFPSVCNKPVVSNGSPAGRDAPLFLPAENAAAAPAGPAESRPASRSSQFPPRIMVISPRP